MTVEYYPALKKVVKNERGVVIEESVGVVDAAAFDSYLLSRGFVKAV